MNVIYGTYSAARDRCRFPPPGEMIEVSGRRVHVWSRGNGTPTVVVLTALGSPSLEWASIAEAMSEYTTVCLYDRPGLGWSETKLGLPTVGGMADDLQRLLRSSELPPPYVLVGHSLGGYVARVYAARHSELIAGLVLVDAPHEEQGAYIRRLLDWRTRMRAMATRFLAGVKRLGPMGWVRLAVDLGLANGRMRHAAACFPPEQIAAGLALSMRAGIRRATAGEVYALISAPAAFRGGRTHLGSTPLVIVTRATNSVETVTGARRVSDRRKRRISTVLALWADLQWKLAAFSTESTVLVATRAGHHVHRDEPELVLQAVRMLVLRHRRDDLEQVPE